MIYKHVILKKGLEQVALNFPKTLDLYQDECEVVATLDGKKYKSTSFLDTTGMLWSKKVIENFYELAEAEKL